MGVSVLVAVGWWVAIVALTPAADRPYVGGSQNNSILNLIFGYPASAGSTGANRAVWAAAGSPGACGARPGLTRLFNSTFGNMMSWLLPGVW